MSITEGLIMLSITMYSKYVSLFTNHFIFHKMAIHDITIFDTGDIRKEITKNLLLVLIVDLSF